MSNQSALIVQRLWNYCNVLRDDGISYGDYLEQLTYLLFLKMDQEQVQELGQLSSIPAGLSWTSLTSLDGEALESHYRHILAELGKGSGLIPVIFRKAQNRIQVTQKITLQFAQLHLQSIISPPDTGRETRFFVV